MRDNLSTYQIWAPPDSPWSDWAKPVLFAQPPVTRGDETLARLSAAPWAQEYSGAAVIADLPGTDGVLEGLVLAELGYRPVPLYNGVMGPSDIGSMVPVTGIVLALYLGADALEKCALPAGAPPVFLLDHNRLPLGKGQPGKFDNRWCVFPQDMPSATYLMQQGIGHVVVHTPKIKDDLLYILMRYRIEGLRVSHFNGDTVKEINPASPKFRRTFYRFGMLMGLTRNPAGGFGGMIPLPSNTAAYPRMRIG